MRNHIALFYSKQWKGYCFVLEDSRVGTRFVNDGEVILTLLQLFERNIN